MIDAVLRRIAARLWSWYVARYAPFPPPKRIPDWAVVWRRENPGRCMYCSCTHWARKEQGVKLELAPHDCIEDKSPPHPLPEARVLSCPRSL